MQPLVVRAPVPAEWGPARVHVGEWADATRHHARLLERLGEALERPGPDGEVLAAFEGAALRGVAVFGWVAGATGAARLALLACDDAGVAPSLVAEVAERLAGRGARFVVAEWPDEPPYRQPASWLREAGWLEAARLRDLVRDDVDLVVLRRDLTA